VYAADNSFPSTFHVTFQREGPQVNPDGSIQPQGLLTVTFLNGTTCTTETASFTFSMEETPKGEYIVKFMLSFEGFYDEVSLPTAVSEGRVYIDSIPTIFVVNPESLIDGKTIQILQTESITLSGTVMRDAYPSTLIDDYAIVSKWVSCYYQQTGDASDQFSGVSYEFFFDSTTGIIVGFPLQGVRDEVLLNKLGVASISNGNFVLSDYSENLNFNLEKDDHSSSGSCPSFSWWLFLIPVFAVVLVLVGVFAYRTFLKKKNGDKRKTFSNNSLKLNFISYIYVRCFYGLRDYW
jgi:hypothetical protein